MSKNIEHEICKQIVEKLYENGQLCAECKQYTTIHNSVVNDTAYDDDDTFRAKS